MGDFPDATPVYDLDSIGILKLASRLNHGVDPGGKPLGGGTRFVLATGAEPAALNYEREIARLEAEEGSGRRARDDAARVRSRAAREILERHARRSGCPVLVGILPLASHRNAEFLHNEVPGMQVPEAVRERMRKAGSGRARREKRASPSRARCSRRCGAASPARTSCRRSSATSSRSRSSTGSSEPHASCAFRARSRARTSRRRIARGAAAPKASARRTTRAIATRRRAIESTVHARCGDAPTTSIALPTTGDATFELGRVRAFETRIVIGARRGARAGLLDVDGLTARFVETSRRDR